MCTRPYAIETIVESREQTRRHETTDRHFLVKWNDSELMKTWEIYGARTDFLSREYFELLRLASAGKDAAG